MCDIKRQMSKLHVCVGRPPDPLIKLEEKLIGYNMTDKNTPIIGKLISAFDVIYGSDNVGSLHREDVYWHSRIPGPQYPNEYDSWMDAYVEKHLPGFNFVKFNEWLTSFRSDDKTIPLNAPCCTDLIPVPSLAGINGELPTVKETPKVVKRDAPTASGASNVNEICRVFARTGACKFGDKCKHSHTRLPCKFFIQGKCTKGNTCTYTH